MIYHLASADLSIDISGVSVRTASGTTVSRSKNTVANEKGAIDQDADVEGVLIINDEVYIDGQRVSKGVTGYVSKKTKKSYSIHWGRKGESPTVTER